MKNKEFDNIEKYIIDNLNSLEKDILDKIDLAINYVKFCIDEDIQGFSKKEYTAIKNIIDNFDSGIVITQKAFKNPIHAKINNYFANLKKSINFFFKKFYGGYADIELLDNAFKEFNSDILINDFLKIKDNFKELYLSDLKIKLICSDVDQNLIENISKQLSYIIDYHSKEEFDHILHSMYTSFDVITLNSEDALEEKNQNYLIDNSNIDVDDLNNKLDFLNMYVDKVGEIYQLNTSVNCAYPIKEYANGKLFTYGDTYTINFNNNCYEIYCKRYNTIVILAQNYVKIKNDNNYYEIIKNENSYIFKNNGQVIKNLYEIYELENEISHIYPFAYKVLCRDKNYRESCLQTSDYIMENSIIHNNHFNLSCIDRAKEIFGVLGYTIYDNTNMILQDSERLKYNVSINNFTITDENHSFVIKPQEFILDINTGKYQEYGEYIRNNIRLYYDGTFKQFNIQYTEDNNILWETSINIDENNNITYNYNDNKNQIDDALFVKYLFNKEFPSVIKYIEKNYENNIQRSKK